MTAASASASADGDGDGDAVTEYVGVVGFGARPPTLLPSAPLDAVDVGDVSDAAAAPVPQAPAAGDVSGVPDGARDAVADPTITAVSPQASDDADGGDGDDAPPAVAVLSPAALREAAAAVATGRDLRVVGLPSAFDGADWGTLETLAAANNGPRPTAVRRADYPAVSLGDGAVGDAHVWREASAWRRDSRLPQAVAMLRRLGSDAAAAAWRWRVAAADEISVQAAERVALWCLAPYRPRKPAASPAVAWAWQISESTVENRLGELREAGLVRTSPGRPTGKGRPASQIAWPLDSSGASDDDADAPEWLSAPDADGVGGAVDPPEWHRDLPDRDATVADRDAGATAGDTATDGGYNVDAGDGASVRSPGGAVGDQASAPGDDGQETDAGDDGQETDADARGESA